MRRLALFGLLATVLVASAAPAFAQSATPASAPAAQAFRKLEYSRAALGDRRDRQRREGQSLHADARDIVGRSEAGRAQIRVRGRPNLGDPAASHGGLQIHREEGLAVTVTTAEGTESKPLAATGGSDLANIRFGTQTELNPLLATKHLDVRVEDITVRLSLEGLSEIRAELDQCTANIGSPAKG